QVTTQVNFQSKLPYNITTGQDDNHDLVINDRPTGIGLCQFLAGQGKTLPGTSCASPTSALIARNTGIGPDLFNIQMNVQKTIRPKREKSTPTNRAGNNGPTGVNNFAQQGGGFPGGGFPGGGGQRGGGGGDFGGGQRGGNFPGGNRGNNGGFNQQTTGPTVTFR